MKKNVFVFIDEFGNTHLDLGKSGTFSHFIYTSIIIGQDKREEAEQMLAGIRKDFNQGSALKSSSISRDDRGFNKRLNILKRLLGLDFIVYALVVDKKKIDGDGLRYKQSFYKYFKRIFVDQIGERYDQYDITSDRLGGTEFQQSLEEYIRRISVQPDLFNQDRAYRLAEDRVEEPLVQLADFLSGCIGMIFCDSHAHERGHELLDLLEKRTFPDFFPNQRGNYLGGALIRDAATDREIAGIALDAAVKAIEGGGLSDDSTEVLKFLLLVFRVSPDRLVEKHDLVERVKRVSHGYTVEALRQSIQELRDAGVLISSIPGKSGYKIPNCENDVIGFYNRYLNSIIPMLRRVKVSEKILRMESLNQVDILTEENNLHTLSELLRVVR